MTAESIPVLVLRLLGAPEVLLDGRRVEFDTRKAVALLAYLAVTGRRHTREELAALLWPESDRTRARSALRRTLSSASAVGAALVVDRADVMLDPAGIDCDVNSFRDAASGSVTDVRRAVGAYRGDFLEGFTLRDANAFEDWRAGVQDQLRRELDRYLALLVDDSIPRGALDDAIALASRRILLDPLNESAHQSLMTLYEWNGQRSDGLRQYRRCVRALERELGVGPLPETTAVYDAIRRHRLPRPEGLASTGSVEADAPAASLGAAPVRLFVGRTAEMDAVAAAWRRSSEVGCTVAVVGEVGSGKTALLTTFAAGLEERERATVVTVRGHEGEQDLAYGAATDLVRALLRANPSVAQRSVGSESPALAWLAPPSPALHPDPSPEASRQRPPDRTRVFDAVRAALERLGATATGVLLVVEDAHWLDAESADLLAYLVRRPVPGVLVAVSWRGTASPSAVAAAVAEELADERALVLRLGPLGRAEVAAVITAHGHRSDDETVQQVEARTGGLPLLVVEAAQAGMAAGGELPGDLDALVRSRIDAAPETTRQVLTAVAVVGAPLDPDLVRAVSGRSDQEVVSALEDAVARGLLVELRGSAEYDVPHDTLRRLAADGASTARRRLLHGRAADALAVRAGRRDRGPGWSGTVARHLELAGRFDEASRWYVQAAQQATDLFGHATAEVLWEAALALGHDLWTGHLGIGDARVRLGRYGAAIAAYEQAAAAAATDEELALVEHRLGGVRDRLGEYGVAETHLETALLLVERVDANHDRRGQLLADLALVSLRLGDVSLARGRAEAAIEATTAGDEVALAQAYDVLGVVSARTGDVEAARDQLSASLQHAHRLAEPAAEIAALNNLARLEARSGHLSEALDLAGRALDRSLVYGDTHRTAALHDHLADLLHQAGRDEEARDQQRQAVSLFATVDSDPDRRPEIWQLVEW